MKISVQFPAFQCSSFLGGSEATLREERHSRPRETAMRFEIDNSAASLPDSAPENQLFARIRTYAK